MFRKLFTVTFVAVLVLTAGLSAQNHMVLQPDGQIIKYKGDLSKFEAQRNSKKNQISSQHITANKNLLSHNQNSVLGLVDTLRYPGPFTTAFNFYGQDWMLQWYEAPADLNIKQVGLPFEVNGGVQAEVKIVKVSWTLDQLKAAGVAQHGYYTATGNGFNNVTAFMDNPDVTGGWVATDGKTAPFAEDLWSDGGVGYTYTPTPDNAAPLYEWVDLSLISYPAIAQGEIFGIAVRNTGVNVNNSAENLQAWASSNYSAAPGWKFYAGGRLHTDPNAPDFDPGWWSREYLWDFICEVELTGDRAPVIEDFTILPSGLDVGPYTVDATIKDDNPGNPAQAGVASAMIHWSKDAGTTWNDVAMTGTEPNFTGQIPAQTAGTTVQYYIEAADVNANSSISFTSSFYVFASTPGVNTLLVFNGFSAISGYPQSYYFGKDWPDSNTTTKFPRDRWAYGALVADVVNNYSNIIEICTSGPNDINNDVIKTWLDASPMHNYMLAGDEWLGTQSGWTNGPHAAGSFQFDVLGINYEHNDVNYAASGDQNKASIIYPQQSSALGGALFNRYTKVSTDSSWTDPMHYDPYYEVGVANWMDGVDFESDVDVFMKGLAIDGSTVYNIGGSRTLPAGNKIAFFAYDPVSIDTYDGADKYFWYGFTKDAPQVEVLKWFGLVTGIKPVDNQLPAKFDLSQNYPNPFNPSTTINFALPQASNVVLKVYDVLGREVATLLNGDQTAAGNYKISFDASKLSSGLYFYTLNAGSFTSTKKMMLIK